MEKHSKGNWSISDFTIRTMQKHSKGNWRIASKNTPSPFIDIECDFSDRNGGTCRYVIAGVHKLTSSIMTEKEAEANAKLIAAAPELLNALIQIEIMARTGQINNYYITNMIQELLKKTI